MDFGGFGGLIGGGLGFLAGGPAGAAVGASIGGGIDTNSQNAASAASAQAFSEQQYATRWQTTTKDMQAAGLNPMLAYSQGVGNAPTGNQYQAANPYANVAGNYSAAANLDNAGKLMDAQATAQKASAAQSEAAARQADATVSKIGQELINLQTDNEKGRALIDNLAKEGQNLVKQGWNLTEVGNQLRATVTQLNMDARLKVDQSVLAEAQTYLTQKNTELAGFDVKAASDMGNVGRQAGQLKPVLDILMSILRSSRR